MTSPRARDRSSFPKRGIVLLALVCLGIAWLTCGAPSQPEAAPSSAGLEPPRPAIAQESRVTTQRSMPSPMVAPPLSAGGADVTWQIEDTQQTLSFEVPVVDFHSGAAGAPAAPPTDGYGKAAQRWERERADPAWTNDTRQYLTNSLLDLKADGRLVDVACRQTLCRVHLDFGSLQAASLYGDQVSEPERRNVRAKPVHGRFLVDAFLER